MDITTGRLRRIGLSLAVVCGSFAFAACSLSIGTGLSAGSMGSLEIRASRTAGVAPLSVHFFAINNRAGDIDFIHDDCVWDFDDPNGGYWGTVTTAGTAARPKNIAKGGVAAHVFETAGEYLVSVTLRKPGGSTISKTISITVIDPDIYYAGEKTICVSASGDFSGAPEGSIHEHTSDLSSITSFATAGRRMLFHRGESWSTSGLAWPANGGPVTIGAYGTGIGVDSLGMYSNAPTITMNSGHFKNLDDVQDWRVIDLRLIDPTRSSTAFSGAQNMQRLLFLRLKLEGFNDCINLSHWNSNYGTILTNDQIAIVSCDMSGSQQHIAYIGGERLAILGSILRDVQTEHVLRVWQSYCGVISGNLISGGGLATSAKHALKLHGPGSNTGLGLPLPGTANLEHGTRYTVVSDNVFGGSGPWPVAIGPQSSDWDERLTGIVFERNRISSQYGTSGTTVPSVSLILWASCVSIRNNVIDGTGSVSDYVGVMVSRRGAEPAPCDVEIFNNTFYSADSSAATRRVGIFLDSSARGITAMNNLATFPESTAENFVLLNWSSGLIASCNSCLKTPGFIDPDNGTPLSRNFGVHGGAAYVVNAGARVPIYDDFNGNERPNGAYDIGAYEYY